MSTDLIKIPVARKATYQASGTKSYVYLLRKWGFKPTMQGPFQHSTHADHRVKCLRHSSRLLGRKPKFSQALIKVQADESAGEVTAEDQQNDSLYCAQVSIGTPAQNFKLDVDTGSADLWVWSTELSKAIQTQGRGHSIFDPKKSSTFKKQTGSSWELSYGDRSSASGSVGRDDVTIGGLTIKNQAIELASTLSYEFIEGTGSGLLGLGFSTINSVRPQAVKTPVENMIAQGDIPSSQQLFTAKLGSWRDANEPDKGKSFYTFGFIDEATVQASGQQVKYASVDSTRGFWMFASTAAVVNGKTINLPNNTAIADTGTTLALVSDQFCEALYNAIPGARYDGQSQGYVFPADTAAEKLPKVTIAVGENQFTIQKEDLGFADAGNGMVYGGVQSRGDMGFDILGDTFLKGIYAVFDVGNMRFGAVERKETSQNTTPTPS